MGLLVLLAPRHQKSQWWQVANNSVVSRTTLQQSWRHHQMETFSVLLDLCAGNSPGTGEFPAQKPVIRNFMFSLICDWDAGDLRRHRTHYDVIVMQKWILLIVQGWHLCVNLYDIMIWKCLPHYWSFVRESTTGGFPHRGPVMWVNLSCHPS